MLYRSSGKPEAYVREGKNINGMLNATLVSDIFIDEYMSEADGESVKIYLYLLRVLSDSERRFSIPEVCADLSYSALSVTRALMYWEEKKLLRLSFDAAGTITGVSMLRPERREEHTDAARPKTLKEQRPQQVINEQVPAQITREPSLPKNDTLESLTPPRYSKEELNNFLVNDEISELMAVAEGYMRHPLSVNDMNSIIFWYDSLGLPIDVIEYLMEYCMENGHQSIRYMHKCAIDWAENGIYTLSEAKQRNRIHQKAYYSIIKAFGIKDRNLIPSELELMEKWTKEYRLPIPVIEEAAKRSLRNTGRVSFNYADSILSDWRKAGVNSIEDIKRLDTEYAKKNAMSESAIKKNTANPSVKKTGFHNFDERENDYAALESMALRS